MAPRQQGKSRAPQSSGGGGGGIGGATSGGGGGGGGGMDPAATHSWLGPHSRPSPQRGSLGPVTGGVRQQGCPREPHGTHSAPSGLPTSKKPSVHVFPDEHSTPEVSDKTRQQSAPVAPQGSQTRVSAPPALTVLQLLPTAQPLLPGGRPRPVQQGSPVAPQGGAGGAEGSTQMGKLKSPGSTARPALQVSPSADTTGLS